MKKSTNVSEIGALFKIKFQNINLDSQFKNKFQNSNNLHGYANGNSPKLGFSPLQMVKTLASWKNKTAETKLLIQHSKS